MPKEPTPAMKPLWRNYVLEILVDRLVAGIPASEKMLDAWLAARALRMRPATLVPAELEGKLATTPAEAKAEHMESAAQLDTIEVHGVVFFRDGDGRACYEGRCMKGALKEAANVLKATLDVKAFRSKLAERVFVLEKLVPITSEIQSDDRPLTVMTAQGPRTSIKRFEFAENVPMTFHLRVLNDDVVSEDQISTMLEYMTYNGVGADRSQGVGTFHLVKFAAI